MLGASVSDQKCVAARMSSAEEVDLVLAVAGLYHGTEGRFVDGFEAALAQMFDVPAAVVASSDCGAVSVLIGALGLIPGGEVILPATAEPWLIFPWLRAGLQPVFTDFAENVLCPGAPEIEAVVSKRTRIVVASPPWGYPWDLCGLSELTRRLRLPLVVDLSQSFGTDTGMGSPLGMADIGILSLRADQSTISTGEGGALLFAERKLAARAKSYARFSDLDAIQLGINQKMSEPQAALGSGRLAKFSGWLDQQRSRADALEATLIANDVSTYPGLTYGRRNGAFVIARAGAALDALGLKTRHLTLAIDTPAAANAAPCPHVRKAARTWQAVKCPTHGRL
jgi:perosamine synthetase